jgi:hypothetical protein
VPTLGLLTTRPPASVQEDGEEGLDALLELLASTAAAPPVPRPSFRSSAARLAAWVRGSSRRAAAWGAAPAQAGGAW